MKRCLMRYLLSFVFAILMVVASLQTFHVSSARSAHAMGWIGGHDRGGGSGATHDVPEPGTLSMLLIGVAGAGTYLAIRKGRKGRKK